MDWKVVAAAPLVIENQLPVRGTYMIWETPRVGGCISHCDNTSQSGHSMSCIYTLNLFQLLLLCMHVLFMLLLGKHGQETQNSSTSTGMV